MMKAPSDGYLLESLYAVKKNTSIDNPFFDETWTLDDVVELK